MLTGLPSGRTEYFQAWAHNAAGRGVGSPVSFTTTNPATVPTVVTNVASNVGSTSATLNAQVTDTGGAAISYVRFIRRPPPSTPVP